VTLVDKRLNSSEALIYIYATLMHWFFKINVSARCCKLSRQRKFAVFKLEKISQEGESGNTALHT